MDNNRFFKAVWRVNALLVMCALLLFIGKSIYDEILRRQIDYTAVYNSTTFTTDDSGTLIQEGWRYGNPNEMVGASSYALPLYSIGRIDKNKPTYQLRNFAFVDNDFKNVRWLLPDNLSPISSYEFLKPKDQETVLGILYEILDEDTDKASVYLSRPNGETLTLMIANIDRLMGQPTIDGNYVIVFYVKEGAAYSARIDLSSFSVVDNIALPAIK